VNTDLKTIEEIEPWVYLGLALTQVNNEKKNNLEKTAQLVLAYVNNYSSFLPIGILYDIYNLLCDNKIQQEQEIQNKQLHNTLWEYKENIVHRLNSDPKFESVKIAFSRLTKELQYEAAAFVTNHIREHVKFENTVHLSIGVIRKILCQTNEEIRKKSLEYLNDESLCSQFIESYSHLVKKSRYVSSLITDQVVYVVENLSALRTESKRLLAKQLIDVAEKIDYNLPKSFRRKKIEEGQNKTKIEDEDSFPTGGFSSISNRGSFENLVCSELVFMEKEKDFDLFDVRYSEGELLYYTRDENTFTRPHKDIYFVFDSSLKNIRFRDSDIPWQRLVIVFGMIISIIRNVIKALSEESLEIVLVFKNCEELSEEKEILKILFSKLIETGVVKVQDSVKEKELEAVERIVYVSTCKKQNGDGILLNVDKEVPEIWHKNKINPLGSYLPWKKWIETSENLINTLL
jgi:hypothetical protein